ncbi:MAG: cobalt ECF transporter T component CbiQ [Cyanobacteriota bacterium]|nr:cobalt ECF transporter T component CbiQ [Cyanobacteriota bacterium]
MKFALDEYAHLNSPIHRWDPRYKLIGLIALIFAFASVTNSHLIPAMLLIAGILYAISKLPLSFLLKRLRYPGFFLLGIVMFLPFVLGKTIILQLGFLTIRQEGIVASLLVASRFLAIMTTSFVLFGTSYFLTTIKAMRRLGLSPIIADIILLSYRYLFEVYRQLKMMQRASKLRGFEPRKFSRRNLSVYAALTGSLLVRSYEDSTQIYKAMQLRGYGHVLKKEERAKALPNKTRQKQSKLDATGLFICLVIAVCFIGAEVL